MLNIVPPQQSLHHRPGTELATVDGRPSDDGGTHRCTPDVYIYLDTRLYAWNKVSLHDELSCRVPTWGVHAYRAYKGASWATVPIMPGPLSHGPCGAWMRGVAIAVAVIVVVAGEEGVSDDRSGW